MSTGGYTRRAVDRVPQETLRDRGQMSRADGVKASENLGMGGYSGQEEKVRQA